MKSIKILIDENFETAKWLLKNGKSGKSNNFIRMNEVTEKVTL